MQINRNNAAHQFSSNNLPKLKLIRRYCQTMSMIAIGIVLFEGKQSFGAQQSNAAASNDLTNAIDNAIQAIREQRKEEKAASFSSASPRAKAKTQEIADSLKNSDKKVRQRAARYLGILRDPDIIQILGKVATQDPDLDVRQHAILALGQMKDIEAIHWLATSLTMDKDLVNRKAAAITLGLHGGNEGKIALKSQIDTTNSSLKLSICRGLAMLGDNTCYQWATQSLDDADSNNRGEAVQILGLLGEISTISILEPHLKDSSRDVQFRVLEAIRKIQYRSKPYPENLAFLKTSLDDPSGTVRLWAARELLDMNREEALLVLRQKALEGANEARNVLAWKAAEIYSISSDLRAR